MPGVRNRIWRAPAHIEMKQLPYLQSVEWCSAPCTHVLSGLCQVPLTASPAMQFCCTSREGGSCERRCAPLEELSIGLRGDDALDAALCTAVRAHNRHVGAKLAAV